MLDAVIFSDSHLGAANCEAKLLLRFLHSIRGKTKRLIINGDFIDTNNFNKLRNKCWKVIHYVRKLMKEMEVVYIKGNHEENADEFSHILNQPLIEEYILESGNEKILILHGDKYDTFLKTHPYLTIIGDCIYNILQRLDKRHDLARYIKHLSKHYIKCMEHMRESSREEINRRGFSAICSGHSHTAESNYPIFNSGSFVERPCSYLLIKNGKIELKFY